MFADDEDRPSGKTGFNVMPDLSQDPAYASTILPTGTGGLSRDELLQPDEIQRRTQRIQAEDPIAKRKELASVYQTPSVIAGQPVVTPPAPTTTTPVGRDIDAAFDPVPVQQPIQTTFDTFVTADGTVTRDDATRTPLGFAAAADSRREQQAALQDQMATAIPTTTVDSRIDVSRQPTIEAPDPRLDVSRQPTIEAPYPTQPVTTTASYGPPSVSSAGLGGDPSIDFSEPTVDPRPAIAFDPSTSAGDPAISGISQATSLAPDVSLRPQARPAELAAAQPAATPEPKEDRSTKADDPGYSPVGYSLVDTGKVDADGQKQYRMPTAEEQKEQRVAVATASKQRKDPVQARKDTASSQSKKSTNIASSGRSEAEIQAEINKELAGGEWTERANELVKERDSARANEGGSRDKGGDSGGASSGGGCVIATHGISTGGFSALDKAKAEIWCERTYHGKWYGEAFRRGYRYAGNKAIQKGKAEKHYQEFKDFVACGRGIKKDWKSKINYYKRTVQFFLTGLIVKEDV